MTNYCHLSYKERKNIEDELNYNKSIYKTSKEINRSNSTISREIDRNKELSKHWSFNMVKRYENLYYNPYCDKLDKPLYVCNGCKSRSECRKERYIYYARKADNTYKEVKMKLEKVLI